MPSRIRSRRIASELHEGPTVQMILARRTPATWAPAPMFSERLSLCTVLPDQILGGPNIVYGVPCEGACPRLAGRANRCQVGVSCCFHTPVTILLYSFADVRQAF